MFLQKRRYSSMPHTISPFRDILANHPERSDSAYLGQGNCNMSEVKLTSGRVSDEVTEV